MRISITLFLFIMAAVGVKAQIGYQVALMDQSTGKPRTNETVSATVTITDNAGTTICSTTKNVTTNEFGMIAIEVGDSDSFKDVDWSKLPLWVTATVGGVTVGKSQILNVPVAEHANHWGTLTKKILCSKTWHSYGSECSETLTFSSGGTMKAVETSDGYSESRNFTYRIVGDIVTLTATSGGMGGYLMVYDAERNYLIHSNGAYFK